MYSLDIVKSSIKLYFKLEKENIIGKNRIKIINSTFNLHINTLYRWINLYKNSNELNNESNNDLNDSNNLSFSFDQYNTHYKYNNIKINYDIEQFIINSIDSNKNFNIKKIKKSINEKFNILLSKSTIYNVLHKHKLTYKKITIKTNPLKSERELILKQKLKEEIKETNINNLSSYDEMAIYINDIPYKGWSKKGEKCIILNKNISILPKRI